LYREPTFTESVHGGFHTIARRAPSGDEQPVRHDDHSDHTQSSTATQTVASGLDLIDSKNILLIKSSG
jgi:hypothetical protein